MKTDALRPSRLFAGWLRWWTMGVCLGLLFTGGVTPTSKWSSSCLAQSITPPLETAQQAYSAFLAQTYETLFGQSVNEDQMGYRLDASPDMFGMASGSTLLGDHFTVQVTYFVPSALELSDLDSEVATWATNTLYESGFVACWVAGTQGSVGMTAFIQRYWHNNVHIVDLIPICSSDPSSFIPDSDFVSTFSQPAGSSSSAPSTTPPAGDWTSPKEFLPNYPIAPCLGCCHSHHERMTDADRDLVQDLRDAADERDSRIESAWSSYRRSMDAARATRDASVALATAVALLSLVACSKWLILGPVAPVLSIGAIWRCAGATLFTMAVAVAGIEIQYQAAATGHRNARQDAIDSAQYDFVEATQNAQEDYWDAYNDSVQLLEDCLELHGCPPDLCPLVFLP